MATINAQRHQMIKRAVMRRPEAVAELTIDLWERLAAELISIIGEGGFQSLYSRSIYLTSASFPWIATADPPQQAATRFSGLKKNLEGKNSVEAGEASIALLITFIDILSLLIGELLTVTLLRSAWGDDALDTAVKELRK